MTDIHSIVSDEALNDFLNKRISLRNIIYDSNSVFIVDKGYNNDIKDSALIPLEDLPNDYLPLENSFFQVSLSVILLNIRSVSRVG